MRFASINNTLLIIFYVEYSDIRIIVISTNNIIVEIICTHCISISY